MAFRTQKISQMTPKGADLEATDLIEVSTIESGSYVTRSITGQELIDAIPPTTIEWGDIGGTLSDQTDLNTALNAKVPTSRTLTINGVTQDLSANRTFTISTGITIGSTAIASGVVGRVLFEGAGNVVQESGNLFWDNTNGRLGIGTSSPARRIDVLGSGDVFTGLQTTSATGAASHVVLNDVASSFEFGMWGSTRASYGAISSNNAYIYGGVDFAITSLSNIKFGSGASVPERMRIVGGTGNVLINTTTDAGFRLDVNGTARVQGSLSLTTGNVINIGSVQVLSPNTGNDLMVGFNNSLLTFYTGNNPVGRFFSTGNFAVGTTADNGFKLDVNGTARVQDNLTIVKNQNTSTIISISNTNNSASSEVSYNLTSSNGTASFAKKSASGSVYKTISGNDAYIYNGTAGDISILNDTTGRIKFAAGASSTAQMTLFSTGNLGINTTTDAGFRLDVNGTARVSGATTFNNSLTNTLGGFIHSSATSSNDAFYTLLSSNIRFYVSANGYCKTTTSIVTDANGAGSVNASAISQIDSTTKGFLPPRMTTTQKNAIASPATGLVVYDTTLNKLCVYTTAWETVTSL